MAQKRQKPEDIVHKLPQVDVLVGRKRGSELHFWFPEPLIPIIKEPLRFAWLRVHFLIKLSGKYAVTLYEILEGFANRHDGECRVTIEELRCWLKVPDGTYPDWKNFRHRVLRPAIEQINADPASALAS